MNSPIQPGASARKPGASARTPAHTRTIQIVGYRRDDGLWDIEAKLLDTRSYDSAAVERGTISAGDAIHDITVCITINDALEVLGAQASMQTYPFHNCPGALPSLSGLVGATLGPGWRRRINTHLGGEQGCTHIREVLLQIATTAYQTVPVWHVQKHGDVMVVPPDGKAPLHLGQCHGWALDGPIVARVYPQFAIKPVVKS